MKCSYQSVIAQICMPKLKEIIQLKKRDSQTVFYLFSNSPSVWKEVQRILGIRGIATRLKVDPPKVGSLKQWQQWVPAQHCSSFPTFERELVFYVYVSLLEGSKRSKCIGDSFNINNKNQKSRWIQPSDNSFWLGCRVWDPPGRARRSHFRWAEATSGHCTRYHSQSQDSWAALNSLHSPSNLRSYWFCFLATKLLGLTGCEWSKDGRTFQYQMKQVHSPPQRGGHLLLRGAASGHESSSFRDSYFKK